MLITITGSSGSGKSFISNYLCSLNNKMIALNIDEVGHTVLEIPHIKDLIAKSFNLNLYNGQISRKELGELVFNNQQKMQELTDITWQAMEKLIDEFIALNQDKIIVLDWILLPKTKYFSMSDYNILIIADYETRMKRALLRDNIDESKFQEREQATIDYSQNTFDYIIVNNNLDTTKRMVKKIYDQSIISG